MKVFHGSYTEIEEIDLSKGELQRDFGKAFYVTKLREQAEYWAGRKGYRNNTSGFITEFTFFESAFTTNYYKTLRFEDYTEEWLDFVILNRKNDTQNNIHDYDIIEGPVADDAIATRIILYLKGGISKTDFLEDLRFKHSVSHQIAFCTEKSLVMLTKSWNKIDLNEFAIDEAVLQSLVVDFDLNEQQAIDLYFQSNTYNTLIDETTKLYEKPWTEIYKLLLVELNLKPNKK
ncbi:MAG: DUF3990 domain-containing protein [Flavobacteriaceae bacterium]|jgi:hypothetical protein|nr:DUF3990 domain-containing protein [Flavobacteriaceae bacterium]